MRHDLVLEGVACRLRPVCDADAGFIVGLRQDASLKRYLHAGAVTADQQLDWLARYYERPGDFYFVVEALADGAPQGLVALYDLDPDSRTAEWGRWILRPRSRAAIESAWLTYRCGFERLDLSSVYCRTVADNRAVVSFHDSCGILRRELLPAHFKLEGQIFDAIEHRVLREDWTALAPPLEKLIRRSARIGSRHATLA